MKPEAYRVREHDAESVENENTAITRLCCPQTVSPCGQHSCRERHSKYQEEALAASAVARPRRIRPGRLNTPPASRSVRHKSAAGPVGNRPTDG